MLGKQFLKPHTGPFIHLVIGSGFSVTGDKSGISLSLGLLEAYIFGIKSKESGRQWQKRQTPGKEKNQKERRGQLDQRALAPGLPQTRSAANQRTNLAATSLQRQSLEQSHF